MRRFWVIKQEINKFKTLLINLFIDSILIFWFNLRFLIAQRIYWNSRLQAKREKNLLTPKISATVYITREQEFISYFELDIDKLICKFGFNASEWIIFIFCTGRNLKIVPLHNVKKHFSVSIVAGSVKYRIAGYCWILHYKCAKGRGFRKRAFNQYHL